MAKKIYRGDSVPFAQVTTVTPQNVLMGDTFTVGCNGKNVTVTAPSNNASDVVTALVNALQNSGIPELGETLISASAGGTFFTLVAATAGVPFAITTSTTGVISSGSVSITEQTAGKLPTNTVQEVALIGTYTGGTFAATWNFGSGNETTSALAYNATAATVQAAIEALPTPVPGDVTVTGGPGPGSPWFITFKGQFSGTAVAAGTIDGTLLTGNGSVQITTAQQGHGPSSCLQHVEVSHANELGLSVFMLKLDGQSTTTMVCDSTPALIQSSLEALPNIGAGNVQVFSTTNGGIGVEHFFILFQGALANQAVSQLVITDGSGNPSPAGSVCTVLQQGGQTTEDGWQFVDLGRSFSGTFELNYQGQSTGPINIIESAAGNFETACATALNGLSTISGSMVAQVYGTTYLPFAPEPGDITCFMVRMIGAQAAGMTALSVNTAGLTGTGITGTVTVALDGIADVDEIQKITVFGTGGTFTLSAGSQTTSAIAWNAAGSTLVTRIDTDLSATFTTVTVTGSGTVASPYVMTVTSPANTNIAQLTANPASLTGGGGQITVQTSGAAGTNEVQLITLSAGVTAGSFQLLFLGSETVTIAYNASAATMQSDLRALPTVNTVSVSGSAGGPWTVTWSGAQGAAPQPLIAWAGGTSLIGPVGTQTLTATNTTFSSGPLHYDDPLNWLPAGTPNSEDDVYFVQGTGNCLYGIEQLATFTANASTDVVTFTSTCNLQMNQIVHVTSDGTLPAGLTAGTDYYLIGVDRNAGTCQLSTSLGGSAVNITSTGSGNHTIGVRLDYLEFDARWTGSLGLPFANSLGYVEYRPRNLHIGLSAAGTQQIVLGLGIGSGSPKIQIDNDVDQVAIKQIASGGSSDQGIPATVWKGTNTANTVEVINGDFGTALFAGEIAALARLTQRGGTVAIGAGVTINGPIDKIGGQLTINGAIVNGNILSN